MYKRRYIEKTVLKTSKTFKILYLGGPRQVGKTTMLLNLAIKFRMNYVSLDDLAERNLAQSDPELFLQKHSRPLLIDEVQYAPQLFPVLKIMVDKTNKNGQYWLTGSQQFSIMKNVQESLAGRVGILNLLGFSFAEERNIPKSKNVFYPGKLSKSKKSPDFNVIFKHILRGSFPALAVKNPPSISTFYNSYLQTYLDRDLKDIFNISKISTFNRFLELCASRTAQILNYNDLARDAGISVNASREWLGILEASMQVYLLRPYYRNISKRLIKAPKLYFLDTGLAAFLTKWKTSETLSSSNMAGAFFETFVISEVIKSYLYRGEEPPIYYFRDKQGHEVDLLIERDGKVYPVEIKMKARIDSDDLKNLEYLRKLLPSTDKGAVISMASSYLPLNKLYDNVPVGMVG